MKTGWKQPNRYRQSLDENSMLYLLTLLHLAVDGVCGASLCAYELAETDFDSIVRVFALYNLMAFGGQGLSGWFLDRKATCLPHCLWISVLLLGLGMLLPLPMLMRALLLGAGNCLFHVAGGSLVLCRYEGFQEPGIFVSSGAVGLALGLGGHVGSLPFLALCAVSTGICLLLLHHERAREEQATSPCCPNSSSALPAVAKTGAWTGGLCAVLLLGCVVLRGFGGNSTSSQYFLLLACILALGKALGGVCCDKFGYRKTILLIFLTGTAALMGSGMVSLVLLALSFNMTMPLTLRLLHTCHPSRPGLMFGLAAGCLLPGAFFSASFFLPPQAMLVIQFLSLFLAGHILTKQGCLPQPLPCASIGKNT